MKRFILFGLAVAVSLTLCSNAAAIGPVGPAVVTGKEYSHHFDHDAAGALDPEQAVAWDGSGGAVDTFDFTPGAPGPVRVPFDPVNGEGEVDAMAFDQDAFFGAVQIDTQPMIFSTDGDPAIYFEEAGAAVGGVWAAPPMINAGVVLTDIDAIEVWGPDSPAGGASGDDAFNYSLETLGLPFGVPDPGGVSVWHVPSSAPGALGPVAIPLVLSSEIAIAVGSLLDEVISEDQINLDGMMLNILEVSDDHTTGMPGVRRADITFTLDPIVTDDSGVILDGGEIFTWSLDTTAAPVPAAFLKHGGHTWDTAFGVMATYGTASENVNGLEGVEAVPEPSTCLLCMLGSLGLVATGRRRRRNA